MSQFARPNRTKTMFATIDANRPTYARQKLGGIESSQNVVKNMATAQGAENTNVQNATQNVKDTTRTDYQGGSAFIEAGKRVADQGAFVNQAGPTFDRNLVSSSSAAPRATTSADGTQTVNTGNVNGVVDAQFANTVRQNDANLGVFSNAGVALQGMTTGAATDELGAAYGAEVDRLDVAGKRLTEGNLGRLADTSEFEDQQLQLASVLADRQSNIGKLRALYGVGYDAEKYGALDSNILQGQFNDAATAATENLTARDSMIKTGDRVREQYGNQVADSRKITGEAKAVADKELVRLDGELNRLDIAISKRITDEGVNRTAATTALQVRRKKIKDDYAAQLKRVQDAVAAENARIAAARAVRAKEKLVADIKEEEAEKAKRVEQAKKEDRARASRGGGGGGSVVSSQPGSTNKGGGDGGGIDPRPRAIPGSANGGGGGGVR